MVSSKPPNAILPGKTSAETLPKCPPRKVSPRISTVMMKGDAMPLTGIRDE